MTCPRCSIGLLPDDTHRCPLCGLVPGSMAVVRAGGDAAVDDIVARELGAQFRIERALKRGPASHVFLVRDAEDGRAAALKVIVPRRDMPPVPAARFRDAARSAAGLDHPHIVRPYRHGVTDALRWYAMEYVPARSLAEVIAGRPLDVSRTWHIAQQVASALDYAHRRGLAHGALTPRDVLLDDGGWVRVLDVGMAPAPVSPAADQYALALVVRECLTGVVSPHVGEVLARAMAPRPVDRFSGVLDFVAALTGPETAPRPLGFAGRAPERGPRPRVLLIEPEPVPRRPRRFYRAGIALALAMAAGVLWLGWERRDGGSAVPAPAIRTPPVTAPPPGDAVVAAPTPIRLTRPPARSLAPGYLSVNALPWAVLSVDGRLIGNTPQIKLRLPAGVHRFRLVRDGFRPYDAAVALKSGETVRLTSITLDPISQ